MVKYITHINNPLAWLKNIEKLRGQQQLTLLQKAVNLYHPEQQSLLEKGIDIADILLQMGLDNDSLAAAILYPLIEKDLMTFDMLIEQFDVSKAKLMQDVMQLRSLGQLQHLKQQRTQQQIENLRKMLLAIVTDVRAVLIILAERLWLLRKIKLQTVAEQKQLAEETMAVFAPLANRLGVWHLKWEMEDLCLRYLQPEVYTTIAKWLAVRRIEREAYNQTMIETLMHLLTQAGLTDFLVTGRAKHIYSIYRKMQRKKATLEQIYDISALRVLLPTIADCYTALSLIQNHWPQLQEEFDDYIAQPKTNAYQSIHIVITGPENRYNEIQIRTFTMHEQSELGVAAHWRYKEGVLQPSNFEAKIALLRQVLAWQQEMTAGQTEDKSAEVVHADLLSDRIYVFTPLGDIVDLPMGATALDFAYHIHSELGHRCRGAKVNGSIVPLTYALKTGEKVEVITAKSAHPSRDWLNLNYGYLKTARARAKAAHWFRMHDATTNVTTKEAAKEELKESPQPEKLPALAKATQTLTNNVNIAGIDNLLTKVARCCKPLPGDQVIGYITQTRGISMHRTDCKNVRNLHQKSDRLIHVNWQPKQNIAYPVDLHITAYDREGLLRDITALLASEHIALLALNTTQTAVNIKEAIIYLTIEINDMTKLTHITSQLEGIKNVIAVKRR